MYEKPSYMATKKVLCGRQPGYISFKVFFLCPCCSKKVCFSVYTVAKIKCQVLPILGVLGLQYLFGVCEICAALSGARNS
jgi:hypothetical protein